MSSYRCTGDIVSNVVAQSLDQIDGLRLDYAITEVHRNVLRVELRINVPEGSALPLPTWVESLKEQLQHAVERATGYKVVLLELIFLPESRKSGDLLLRG